MKLIFANERKNRIVSGISHFIPTENKVVKAAVDSANFSLMSQFDTSFLQHEWIENSVSCLEFRSVIAAVDFPAAVHH